MVMATSKQTLFIVTDIETTLKHRIAFDIAWQVIDRTGKVYETGSYVIEDAFKLDVPFFKEKLGWYFSDTYKHLITPTSLANAKQIYNGHIRKYLDLGHKVIFVAYNAKFDATYLGQTASKLLNERWLVEKIQLLDLWHYWVLSAPQSFNVKKPETGNPVTKAEVVYQFETFNPDFVERHIAFSDVEIESELLVKVLRRKQKMPLVNNPSEFISQPWRLLLDRPAFKKG